MRGRFPIFIAMVYFTLGARGQDMWVHPAHANGILAHIDTVGIHLLRPIEEHATQRTGAGMALVNRIIEEAFTHLGKRYSRGSKGPHTFDCSGFTSYVFGRNNYRIGDSSRDQYARNIPVRRNDIQRGDLVFFSSSNSGRGVGHVGIVVDVDPRTQSFTFIHASTSHGVRVDSSTDGYYARRFIGVRRVF